MQQWIQRMMNSPIGAIIAGPTLGAAAAALFAVLCGVLSVALTWRLPTRPARDLLLFVTAGALAGLIVGLIRALDRIGDGHKEEPADGEEVGPEEGHVRRPWLWRRPGVRRFLTPRTRRRR